MSKEQMDLVQHEPVMVEEILFFLSEAKRHVVVDCTAGDGGHSLAVLESLPRTYILGTDIDDAAVEVADRRLRERFKGRFKIAKRDYRLLPNALAQVGIPRISGAILDLGISSRQIDDPRRGFSYRSDALLDMRMNPEGERTARDVLNDASEAELETIFREYGEERFSRQIARAVVKRRAEEAINTTEDLVGTLLGAIPPKARRGKTHPARRVFQALRIAVNDELSRLKGTLEKIYELLEPGGVLLVISYHSLEDRITKDTFRELKKLRAGTIRTKRVLRPKETEIERNSRSRSAKLRVIQR